MKLTKREIYEAAKSQFILDYNYQIKQERKFKVRGNERTGERAKQFKKLSEVFHDNANESFDKIMQLLQLIKEDEQSNEVDACTAESRSPPS